MKIIMIFFWVGFFFFQVPLQHKEEEKFIFILFEDKKEDGMFKWRESETVDYSFLYVLVPGKSYVYGFTPDGKTWQESKESFYQKHKNDIRDIKWLRNIRNQYPDSLRMFKTYIYEEVNRDSVRVVQTSRFVGIE